MKKELISFEEFLEIEKKLEITIGKVLFAERVNKSKKLLKLWVAFSEDSTNDRTVVTNIGDTYTPEDLMGHKFPFVTNLTPVTMMGIESQAMIIIGESLQKTKELTNYSIGTKLL